ncbi:hypothetical protein RFI_02114, partial [Reticulomyxa filosa]
TITIIQLSFGRERDHNDYIGARALIVCFDLNAFQFIKHDQLPTNNVIFYHCFVSKSENGQAQEMMKKNQKYKQNYQMLLFCEDTGLSIEYDEDNNTFQFHKLPVCHDIATLFCMHMCVSMMSSCSLVDIIGMIILFQNQCTSIQFEKTNG